MSEVQQAQRRAQVLARVYDELVAELEAGAEAARHADLITMIGSVDWALNRCRAAVMSHHQEASA